MGVAPDLQYPQIYKVEDTGESSLEGALPWDTILKTRYNAYRSLAPVYKIIGDEYQKRVLTDPGMIYLKNRIDLTDQVTAQKTLSLNLAQRKEKIDLYNRQELENENEYRAALGEKPLESFDDEGIELKASKEIMMEQTQSVMADFITTAAKLGYIW
jgi:carboxyl-terminal processing protease